MKISLNKISVENDAFHHRSCVGVERWNMPNEGESGLIVVDYVYNGDVENIPPVGCKLPIGEGLVFEVRQYGETKEEESKFYTSGKLVHLDLLGMLIIPEGTPIELLEQILGGTE